jgi:diguanylate cyclase (GGDEF)-like protein
VDKIEEAIKVSLQKYGRGNFTRNMVEDFKNRNISGFNTLINYTADNSRLLSERTGQMTLIFAVVSIGAFVTSGFVVIYFRKNLVQRLMKLNKAILGRLAGEEIEIDSSGNDEITDMAKVFLYYDNEVSNREEKLRKIAMIDELTGVSNRRHFMEQGEKELQRSMRYKHNTCLLMMDIDHFKSVNDTYGHHIGDIVLQNIANICSNALRDNDLFGRLGGEEFAAVLVETDPDEAHLAAERIRELVEKARLEAEGELISCTISIGIVCACERYDSLESLMVSADKALYNAKNNGRNRVETFKISPEE